jgi:hypothetical protein
MSYRNLKAKVEKSHGFGEYTGMIMADVHSFRFKIDVGNPGDFVVYHKNGRPALNEEIKHSYIHFRKSVLDTIDAHNENSERALKNIKDLVTTQGVRGPAITHEQLMLLGKYFFYPDGTPRIYKTGEFPSVDQDALDTVTNGIRLSLVADSSHHPKLVSRAMEIREPYRSALWNYVQEHNEQG